MLLPDLLGRLGLWRGIAQRGGKLAVGGGGYQFGDRALRMLQALVHHVVPAAQRLVADQHARRIVQPPGRAQPVRVIGDDEEIERPLELRGTPVVEVTLSPRANRSASSGPSRTPNPNASIELSVWRWVSPQIDPLGILGDRHRAAAVPARRRARSAAGYRHVARGKHSQQRARARAGRRNLRMEPLPLRDRGAASLANRLLRQAA